MSDNFQILALHGFTGTGGDFSSLGSAGASRTASNHPQHKGSAGASRTASSNPQHKGSAGASRTASSNPQQKGSAGASRTAPKVPNLNLNWITPNLPGHGPDPQLDCSPEATTQFINDQYSKLDIEPTTVKVLLGYSMGARAALLHALTYPKSCDALILISGNPGIESEHERSRRREADQALADSIEKKGVAAFLEFWQAQPILQSQQTIEPNLRAQMQTERRQHHPEGLAQSLRQFGQGNFPNLWPRLPELQMPTLLITGSEDTKYTSIAQAAARHIPKAQVRTLPNCGHSPHLEAPHSFLERLESFLSSA